MTEIYVWDEVSEEYLNASGGFNVSFKLHLKRAWLYPMRWFHRKRD